ncbi:MAG: universal stress protein [Pirellula sp.]|nr:universal stress protein [Pirellula sp.]
MKTQKILFPCDFSSKGQEALDYATRLARETGAKLLIVHAQEPAQVYGEGAFYYGIPEPDSAAVSEMLHQIKPSDSTVPYEHHLVYGAPADAIVALAKKENADLIVMCSHGRTGLGRLLLGSVAELVMRRAECPVLIVKPHVKAERPLPVGSAL